MGRWVVQVRFHTIAEIFDIPIREIKQPKWRTAMAGVLQNICGRAISLSEDVACNEHRNEEELLSLPAYRFIIGQDLSGPEVCDLITALDANLPGMAIVIPEV